MIFEGKYILWWGKKADVWRVRAPDGTVTNHEVVKFKNGSTAVEHYGFKELPDGPRAIVVFDELD